jgi:hypothetical protein
MRTERGADGSEKKVPYKTMGHWNVVMLKLPFRSARLAAGGFQLG